MTKTREETTGPTASPSLTVPDDVHVALLLGGDGAEWALLANLALLRFLGGEEPYLREFQAHGVTDPETIVPEDAAGIRYITTPSATCILMVGDGWTATIIANASRLAFIQVTASSDELARAVCTRIAARVPTPPTTQGRVPMIFWHQTSGGARQMPREIKAAAWQTIRNNYPTQARHALDRLVDLSPPETGGRLVLLHGEPGTGKTTALRALARAWAPWCQIDYILDADRLFGLPSYLLEVITNQRVPVPGVGNHTRPWRLLIVEDCDELIRADAKSATGQALSRLLNVTDGMVGQGLQVLVCITTNEDLHRLHPAVIRPGRCLANIAVGRFDRTEAVEWLGTSDRVPAHGASLAELYAIRGDHAPVEAGKTTVGSGQYL